MGAEEWPSYVVRWWSRWPRALVYVGGVLVSLGLAIANANANDPGGAFVLTVAASLFLASGVYEIFLRPYIVTLTPTGVLLDAAGRHVLIPWRRLESVRYQHRTRRALLLWETTEGHRIRTSWYLADREDMLAEIERRCPTAQIARMGQKPG